MIQNRDGNQRRVKGESAQGLDLHLWICVAADADIAHRAFLPRLDCCLQGSALARHLVKPVKSPDIVQPPLVDMIGLQPGQALFELPARGIARCGPCLGDDPHLVSAVFGDHANPLFRLALGVDPGSVEIADAAIDSGVEDLNSLVLRTSFFIDNALGAKAQNGE